MLGKLVVSLMSAWYFRSGKGNGVICKGVICDMNLCPVILMYLLATCRWRKDELTDYGTKDR